MTPERTYFLTATQIPALPLLSSTTLLVQVSLFFPLPVRMVGLRLARGLSPSQTVKEGNKILFLSNFFIFLLSRCLSTIIGSIYSVILQNCGTELTFQNTDAFVPTLEKPTLTQFKLWAITRNVTNVVYIPSDQQSALPYFHIATCLESSCMPLVIFCGRARSEEEGIGHWLHQSGSPFQQCHVPEHNSFRLFG